MLFNNSPGSKYSLLACHAACRRQREGRTHRATSGGIRPANRWADAWVGVSDDGKCFVLQGSKRSFAAWGFNYEHDEQGRRLED